MKTCLNRKTVRLAHNAIKMHVYLKEPFHIITTAFHFIGKIVLHDQFKFIFSVLPNFEMNYKSFIECMLKNLLLADKI